jgi:hypothetical protein
MASYGSFIAICGFEYHGPNATIGFAPRILPENFRAPFTAAEGWGTYGQKSDKSGFQAEIKVRKGRLRLQTIKLKPDILTAKSVAVRYKGGKLAHEFKSCDDRLEINLDNPLLITEGAKLQISVA